MKLHLQVALGACILALLSVGRVAGDHAKYTNNPDEHSVLQDDALTCGLTVSANTDTDDRQYYEVDDAVFDSYGVLFTMCFPNKTTFDNGLSLWSSDDDGVTFTLIQWVDDYCGENAALYVASYDFEYDSGMKYYLQVGGYGDDDTGSYTLEVACIAEDDISYCTSGDYNLVFYEDLKWTWDEARAYCADAFGSDLAGIPDGSANSVVSTLKGACGTYLSNSWTWTGGRRRTDVRCNGSARVGTSAQFEWVDGTKWGANAYWIPDNTTGCRGDGQPQGCPYTNDGTYYGQGVALVGNGCDFGCAAYENGCNDWAVFPETFVMSSMLCAVSSAPSIGGTFNLAFTFAIGCLSVFFMHV